MLCTIIGCRQDGASLSQATKMRKKQIFFCCSQKFLLLPFPQKTTSSRMFSIKERHKPYISMMRYNSILRLSGMTQIPPTQYRRNLLQYYCVGGIVTLRHHTWVIVNDPKWTSPFISTKDAQLCHSRCLRSNGTATNLPIALMIREPDVVI